MLLRSQDPDLLDHLQKIERLPAKKIISLFQDEFKLESQPPEFEQLEMIKNFHNQVKFLVIYVDQIIQTLKQLNSAYFQQQKDMNVFFQLFLRDYEKNILSYYNENQSSQLIMESQQN